jgi:hypothetical protein
MGSVSIDPSENDRQAAVTTADDATSRGAARGYPTLGVYTIAGSIHSTSQ